MSTKQRHQYAMMRCKRGQRLTVWCACATVVVAAAFLTELSGAEPVTITVHAGAQQVFYGLGAGTTNSTSYQLMPQAARDSMAAMVWRDLDFKVLRLMSPLDDYGVEYFVGRFGLYIKEAKKYQPNLILLLTPDMMHNTVLKPPRTDAELRQYAAMYAEQIKRLGSEHGIHIAATGVCNEPNEKVNESGDEWIQRMAAWQVARVVKYFRAELDSRGLSNVEIIAPETSNVDHVARRMVDSIIADPGALAALDGFATHSYNYCMTKEMRDKVAPYGKMYWQTEASSGDPEDFNNAPEAVKGVARFLGDVNLGVNYWLWFLAYDKFKPESNTPRLIGFDVATGIYEAFLKYYYFKQISAAFETGALFRFSTTSLSFADDTAYGYDRYKYMENRVFEKPPVCAAAGVNADSTWAIGIANQTGIVSHWDKASYSPATTYAVTIFVEELKDSGAIQFFVYRSNASMRFELADTVALTNGVGTVTVAPHDLVTLRTNHRYAGRTGVVQRPDAVPSSGAFLRAAHCASASCPGVTITFGVAANAGIAPVSLAAYDLQGRMVATLVEGLLRPGEHTITWESAGADGPPAAGIYVLRLRSGSARRSCRVMLEK